MKFKSLGISAVVFNLILAGVCFADECTPDTNKSDTNFISGTEKTGTDASWQFDWASSKYPHHLKKDEQPNGVSTSYVWFDLGDAEVLETRLNAYAVQKQRYCTKANDNTVKCQDRCYRFSYTTFDHRS